MTPKHGRPVRAVMMPSPSANRPTSPRNRLIRYPRNSVRSSSGSSSQVPTRLAMTPPRSMSATSTTGTCAAAAKPMLAMSWVRRLTSAALPAPSTKTKSAADLSRSKLSRTTGISSCFTSWKFRASWLPRTLPRTTTWAPTSDCGLSRTGFMSTEGGTPQALACSAWARPISPPSDVTAALFDMF